MWITCRLPVRNCKCRGDFSAPSVNTKGRSVDHDPREPVRPLSESGLFTIDLSKTTAERMFVLINGAFGIGKSTVARELRSLLPGAVIFDPEWVGLALQRMPSRKISDFQHL